MNLANLNPDDLVDYSIRLIEKDLPDAALIVRLHALRKNPLSARAHVALAESLLIRDEYLPGFREHEWRGQIDPGAKAWPMIDSAPWSGYHLPYSGRLLVIADQGFGDTLMFSRYLPWANRHCSEVVLACSPELRRLMTLSLPHLQIVDQFRDIPGHTAHVRLSSLPLLHGTTIDNIPPPLTLSPPHPPDAWHRVLAESGLKVGIAWRGREEDVAQRARSVPIRRLLGSLPKGFRFLCLQKGAEHDGIIDPEALKRIAALQDWADTAAVIARLDLVITSDTAIAHLAGTVGTPTWVLLKKHADWRWGYDRDTSPWYPGLRLFRQISPYSWTAVLHQVSDALSDLLYALWEAMEGDA